MVHEQYNTVVIALVAFNIIEHSDANARNN